MSRQLSVHSEAWDSKTPFRITGMVWNDFPAVVCEIREGDCVGRGEALGVYYLDENTRQLVEQIESVAESVAAGADRQAVQELLPPGGARNAIDCALWDLEAQLSGSSVWEMAGTSPGPVETVLTIGLEPEPQQMADKAQAATENTLFKVKLNADRPVERIRAIRQARPDARLVVDANQGWTFDQLIEVAPQLKQLGVDFIEQPLPRGGDQPLQDYQPPLPLCADESCLHRSELEAASTRYQMINIKLDKTGGLTEALLLVREARDRHLGLMVGCMGGTSLSMAPAHVVAQFCDYVDIDGPLLLRWDRPGGLVYQQGQVRIPNRRFWGR